MQVHAGFCQYEPDTLKNWIKSEGLQLTTDILIGPDDNYLGFSCTSSEVVNSVFDDLGRTIDGV